MDNFFNSAEILKIICQQGIWCILFLYLFYQNQKNTEKRENQYLTIIDKYDEKLEEISKTLLEISIKIKGGE